MIGIPHIYQYYFLMISVITQMWNSNVTDMELVHEVDKVEAYSPIVEDISMEDEVLCSAVEKTEDE